jgi:hypothetical protein
VEPDSEHGEEAGSPESQEFDWFDDLAATAWRRRLWNSRLMVYAGPILAVPAIAFPPALGYLIGLTVRQAQFLLACRKWDVGFENGTNKAIARVSSDGFSISRANGEQLFICIEDLNGYTIDLRKRPNLRVYSRDGGHTDFRVYLAEANSAGLWETLQSLDELMPKTSRREYLDGSEPLKGGAALAESRKLLLSGFGTLFVGALAMAASMQGWLSGAFHDAAMTVGFIVLIVGLALMVCSAMAYGSYRRQKRDRPTHEVPGKLIAYYEPDVRGIGVKRALALLLLIIGFIFFVLAVTEWPEFVPGVFLGPALGVIALYLLHMASIEGRAVIVTDQYVGVVRKGKCLQMRHGHYHVFRGSLWFGFYLRFPPHTFVLVGNEGSVTFSNRGNENGFALSRIAEFSREASELADSLGVR